jgi:hypothetical protein
MSCTVPKRVLLPCLGLSRVVESTLERQITCTARCCPDMDIPHPHPWRCNDNGDPLSAQSANRVYGSLSLLIPSPLFSTVTFQG